MPPKASGVVNRQKVHVTGMSCSFFFVFVAAPQTCPKNSIAILDFFVCVLRRNAAQRDTFLVFSLILIHFYCLFLIFFSFYYLFHGFFACFEHIFIILHLILNNKYIVIAARNLKAMDMNGKSDPFVQLKVRNRGAHKQNVDQAKDVESDVERGI